MANDWDITARNVMLTQLGTLAVRVALHTGDPGAANTAANEVSGGGYARQSVAWAASSGGAMAATAPVAFSVPAGTYTYASFWNAAGTTRYAKKATTSTVFGSPGVHTLTTITLDLNDA